MSINAGPPAVTSGAPIVTLADVHAHLNITSTAHDTELQGFIDAATPVIEHITGPIGAAAYVETYDGGGPYIVLRHVPVLAITSITEYRSGVAYPLTGVASLDLTATDTFLYEATTGIVRRYTGSGVAYRFWPGVATVTVSYTAGYAAIPANVRMATLDLIKWWWESTRRGRTVVVGPDFDAAGETLNIRGYLVPYDVASALEPNRRTPGIA